jgi:hypothetical protein
MIINLETANIDGYTKDGIGIWIGKVNTAHDLHVKTISKDNPKADYVFDFEDVHWVVGVNFVVMQSYIRTAVNPIKVLIKALSLIKAGGYLLITDNVNPDTGVKNYFNYNEMEGLLQLLEDKIFIEARGFTGDSKHYYYVCKKKKEDLDDDDIPATECQEVKAGEETACKTEEVKQNTEEERKEITTEKN